MRHKMRRIKKTLMKLTKAIVMMMLVEICSMVKPEKIIGSSKEEMLKLTTVLTVSFLKLKKAL